MSKISRIINLFCLITISSVAIVYIQHFVKSNDKIVAQRNNIIQPNNSWEKLEILEFHQEDSQNKNTGSKYYVDSENGNDNNIGISDELPFKTIGKANKMVKAGDIVYVKNGIYEENITIKSSGNPKKWIVFQAFPAHKPFVKGTQDGTFKVEGNYVKIIGFKITSTRNGSGIFVTNGNHHTKIINNEIHDCGCGGISGMRTDYLYI
ncbi:MAG: DUF1565 domain-containing protein, partial [Sphaerospermopsis sp. SIO1G2]|nr:DUF1565 domain-containing protein [Sphaerospermopsis sp. SIO1G2]